MLSVFNYKIFIQNIFKFPIYNLLNQLQIKWKTKQNSTISKQFQNPIQKSIAKTKHHQAKAVCLTIFRDATSAMRGALPIPDVWSSHVGCLT